LAAAGVPTAVWFVHWRSSLHSLVEFPTYGVGGPLAIGKTEYFGGNVVVGSAIRHPNQPGELSLHISAIRAIVALNTADADISILRCVLANDGPGPDGASRGAAKATCSSLRPFDSGAVTVGFRKGDDDIVVAVSPKRAGKVRISGIELQYSSGLRHGTQHTGVQLSFRTS
jgi:hypothetical protein